MPAEFDVDEDSKIWYRRPVWECLVFVQDEHGYGNIVGQALTAAGVDDLASLGVHGDTGHKALMPCVTT